jgi:hypothetical protein
MLRLLTAAIGTKLPSTNAAPCPELAEAGICQRGAQGV